MGQDYQSLLLQVMGDSFGAVLVWGSAPPDDPADL